MEKIKLEKLILWINNLKDSLQFEMQLDEEMDAQRSESDFLGVICVTIITIQEIGW